MVRLPNHTITITVPEDTIATDEEIFNYMEPEWLDENRIKIHTMNGPYTFRLN